VDGTERTLASPEDLAEELQGTGPLYALLDAAVDPAVLRALHDGGAIFESLYEGSRSRALASVAPYLAQLSVGSALFEALSRRGWGKSWGVVLAAPAPLAEVRRHFRRWLVVETEAGQALHFRFYDPRVLRPFLASATEGERRAFFGPVTAFFVEGRRADTLLRFAREGAAVRAPSPPWDLPRIRDAQLDVFSRERMDAFVERMAERIEDRAARWTAGPGEVRALIREEIERAARHGVAAQGDVERYLGLLGALGPAFDERVAWARAILGRDDLDAEHKLHRLERRARRRPWGVNRA
jgi:hypothetical protein